jgi:excinuclease ABC subunit A
MPLLWRVGSRAEADAALAPVRGATSRPARPGATRMLSRLDGLSIHDLMLLPMDRVQVLLRRRWRCRHRSTRPPTCC